MVRRPFLLAAGSFALLFAPIACTRATTGPSSDAAPLASAGEAPPAHAAAGDAEDAGASVDAGARLLCEGREVAPQLAGLGCHSAGDLGRRPVGFSKDGKYLGVCLSSCDSCPLVCTFEARSGPPLSFENYDARNDPRVPALEASKTMSSAEIDRKLEALRAAGEQAFTTRLEALGLTPGAQGQKLAAAFPYPELALVHRLSHDEKTDVGVVEVGAKVGAEEPVYPIRIEIPPHPMRARLPIERITVKGPERAAAIEELKREFAEQFTMDLPELLYFDLSTDGSDVGVVAAASGRMWFEAAKVKRVPTTAFVGHVLNGTGMRLLTRGDAAGAAALFERAHGVSPTSSLFAYNLACARARAEQGGVEAALAAAIKLGGASVKQRAKTDADLASVRQQPWFVALVGR